MGVSTDAVHKEMNDLIQNLTSEMSSNKLRQLKDIVEAQEILDFRKRQRIPELTVKRFQDLRDHLADRKALENIMANHTSDRQIVIRTVEEPKCNHSCFGTGMLMLIAGAAAGYASVRYLKLDVSKMFNKN